MFSDGAEIVHKCFVATCQSADGCFAYSGWTPHHKYFALWVTRKFLNELNGHGVSNKRIQRRPGSLSVNVVPG